MSHGGLDTRQQGIASPARHMEGTVGRGEQVAGMTNIIQDLDVKMRDLRNLQGYLQGQDRELQGHYRRLTTLEANILGSSCLSPASHTLISGPRNFAGMDSVLEGNSAQVIPETTPKPDWKGGSHNGLDSRVTTLCPEPRVGPSLPSEAPARPTEFLELVRPLPAELQRKDSECTLPCNTKGDQGVAEIYGDRCEGSSSSKPGSREISMRVQADQQSMESELDQLFLNKKQSPKCVWSAEVLAPGGNHFNGQSFLSHMPKEDNSEACPTAVPTACLQSMYQGALGDTPPGSLTSPVVHSPPEEKSVLLWQEGELAVLKYRTEQAEQKIELARREEQKTLAWARRTAEENDRLREEARELITLLERVLQLQEEMKEPLPKRDNGSIGEGVGDTEGMIAQHLGWLSSPALETLAPCLRERVQDLLSDLIESKVEKDGVGKGMGQGVSKKEDTSPQKFESPVQTEESEGSEEVLRGMREAGTGRRMRRGEVREMDCLITSGNLEMQECVKQETKGTDSPECSGDILGRQEGLRQEPSVQGCQSTTELEAILTTNGGTAELSTKVQRANARMDGGKCQLVDHGGEHGSQGQRNLNKPEMKQCFGCPLCAESRRRLLEAEEKVSSQAKAALRLEGRLQRAEGEVESLRHEQGTLRIVIKSLREKEAEVETVLIQHKDDIHKAKLLAVRQEALVSALRKRLESVANQPNLDGSSVAAHPATRAHSPCRDYTSVRPATKEASSIVHAHTIRTPSGKASLESKVNRPPSTDCSPMSAVTPCRCDVTNWAEGQGVRGGQAAAPPTNTCTGGGLLDMWRSALGVDGKQEMQEASCIPTPPQTRPRTPTSEVLRRVLYDMSPCQWDDSAGMGGIGHDNGHGCCDSGEWTSELGVSDGRRQIRRSPEDLFGYTDCGELLDEDLKKRKDWGHTNGLCSREVGVKYNGCKTGQERLDKKIGAADQQLRDKKAAGLAVPRNLFQGDSDGFNCGPKGDLTVDELDVPITRQREVGDVSVR